MWLGRTQEVPNWAFIDAKSDIDRSTVIIIRRTDARETLARDMEEHDAINGT